MKHPFNSVQTLRDARSCQLRDSRKEICATHSHLQRRLGPAGCGRGLANVTTDRLRPKEDADHSRLSRI